MTSLFIEGPILAQFADMKNQVLFTIKTSTIEIDTMVNDNVFPFKRESGENKD